ncbi:MAG: hypothetical protein ABSF64_09355 [Bryobacteraceae bacterium]|jgi:hypothetical protein
MKKRNKHIGSSLEDFLREEGVLEETRAVVLKETLAWQVQQAMEKDKISKVEMARRTLSAVICASSWCRGKVTGRGESLNRNPVVPVAREDAVLDQALFLHLLNLKSHEFLSEPGRSAEQDRCIVSQG